MNNEEEFILSSYALDLVTSIGRDSFAGLSSKLRITEVDAQRIVSDLIQANLLIGVLTLDGKGFVSQKSLVDEIGSQNYEGN